MFTYKFVPSVKKRLKLTVEKIPYTKKKIVREKTYEEKEYERALEAKRAIMCDRKIISENARIKRARQTFENENFKIIKEAGVNISRQETLYYLLFACVLVLYTALSALLAYNLDMPLVYLTIIPIFFICKALIKPRVRFNDLFIKIYLPVCYFCARVHNEEETLKFDIYDKKRNWDKKSVNNMIVTNEFKVRMKKYTADIQKMIVRNYLSTYKMVNGHFEVGKKLATVFSGYSFEINYDKLTQNYLDNEMIMAIVNKNTFIGTDGLYHEDFSTLEMKNFYIKSLNDDWKIYLKKGFEIDKRAMKEIEKKIILIKNEVGAFNVYITPTAVRMMINIQADKNGLKEDFLQAQLQNPNPLTYEGFYAIIKTLCITEYMNKFVRLLFGVKEHQVRLTSRPADYKIRGRTPKIFKSNYLISKVDYEKPQKEQEPKKKRLLAAKKGEVAIETSLALLITVCLSGLILTGFINLLDKNVSLNTISKVDKIYSETNRDAPITDDKLVEIEVPEI